MIHYQDGILVVRKSLFDAEGTAFENRLYSIDGEIRYLCSQEAHQQILKIRIVGIFGSRLSDDTAPKQEEYSHSGGN